MASESSEDLTVSVDLPADLVEWLDEEATAADVDRETAITQLLASYQTISRLNGDVDHESAQFDADELVDALEDGLSEKVESEVEAAIEQPDALNDEAAQRIDSVESTLSDEIDAVESTLSDQIESVESELHDRIESVESDFDEKIKDVRKRVVQLKKETDKKAPKKHTHPEIEALDDLETDIDMLEDELESVNSDYKELATAHSETADKHTERLDELQERLQTVAWVVSDLREERTKSGLDAVDRIKHAAAKADIERAKCENCKQGVQISLMTEPRCPHCEATLSNVEPASGWFGDPTLTVPSQLESGEDS
jgi:hypothetical protein